MIRKIMNFLKRHETGICYYSNVVTIVSLIVLSLLLYSSNKEVIVKEVIVYKESSEDNELKKECLRLKKDIENLNAALNSVHKKEVPHGFNANQLRKIIRNVIIYMGEKDVNDYTELVLLTGIVESRTGYHFSQVKGPALGVFQMEPATEKCIWNNYLKYHPDMKKKIQDLMGKKAFSHLQTNIAYSIAMTYVHYKRTGKKIPSASDKLALTKFYKTYYNTYKGKATVQGSLEKIVGLL